MAEKKTVLLRAEEYLEKAEFMFHHQDRRPPDDQVVTEWLLLASCAALIDIALSVDRLLDSFRRVEEILDNRLSSGR